MKQHETYCVITVLTFSLFPLPLSAFQTEWTEPTVYTQKDKLIEEVLQATEAILEPFVVLLLVARKRQMVQSANYS